MRVLIVDDEREKTKEIYEVLVKGSHLTEDMLEYVFNLRDAKEKLLTTDYDLLILDLNMPETIVNEAEKEGGADFIDEILGSTMYRLPEQIVILSAYEECEKNFQSKNTRKGFSILRYDETSKVWKESLKAIANYRLQYSLQNSEQIDYAIISTVPVETAAVDRLSETWQQKTFDDDPCTYKICQMENDNTIKKVVTVQSQDMGMVAATVTTMNIIKHFSPKYIIIVGIAAGIGKKNVGDILIPKEVWNYSSGKYKVDQGERLFQPDAKSISLNQETAKALNKDFSNVLYKIRKDWMSRIDVDISIDRSPMACGESVVADSDIVKDYILQHSRKSGGIDMESYGVFYACNSNLVSKTIPICIKSISDFANEKKGDDYQEYASYVSANFAKHVILNVL